MQTAIPRHGPGAIKNQNRFELASIALAPVDRAIDQLTDYLTKLILTGAQIRLCAASQVGFFYGRNDRDLTAMRPGCRDVIRSLGNFAAWREVIFVQP